VAGFRFGATVKRVVDGDTILVDPQIYPMDTLLRVRLKDAFEPEAGEEGGEEATERARAMFPEGSSVVLTNTRSRFTYGRLEARVDKE
jgi:endonuclease YncB( thermonuclease family)